MTKILAPSEFIYFLSCSCSAVNQWHVSNDTVFCKKCSRTFYFNENVLDLISESELDHIAGRERQSSLRIPDNTDEFLRSVRMERYFIWRNYHSRSRKKPMKWLARQLMRTNYRQIFLMGAGTGRELLYFQQFVQLKTVLCSDVSGKVLKMIPCRCEPYNYTIALFTADIKRYTIIDKESPIIFINVLHHTSDMHAILEGYCKRAYSDIFMLESCDNVIMRFFARFGLSRRKEYSGIIPDRLNIRKMQAICRKHRYTLSLKTWWIFPRDYYYGLFGRIPGFENMFFFIMEILTTVTGLFKFGNVVTAHLKKS